ncbi:hypothetical protein MMC18_007662 [Xylographa bjoerkii]|nr:hypothetical protein [Xylographa bjoerkii]
MEINTAPIAKGSTHPATSNISGWALDTRTALEAVLHGHESLPEPVKVIEYTKKQAAHFNNGVSVPSFSMRDLELKNVVSIAFRVDLEKQPSPETSVSVPSSRDPTLVTWDGAEDVSNPMNWGYKTNAPFAIGGAILADCWAAEEGGKSIGIYTLAPLLGPVVGPIVGGFITQHTTWRWTFWATSIASGLVQIVGLLYLRETFAPKILAKRAKQPRLITGNQAWHTKWETADRTLTNILRLALVRPFVLLGTQPIIQVLSLYMAYLFGVM